MRALRSLAIVLKNEARANVDKAKKLIEAGFEYVGSHNETMLFRKRKWARSGKLLSFEENQSQYRGNYKVESYDCEAFWNRYVIRG